MVLPIRKNLLVLNLVVWEDSSSLVVNPVGRGDSSSLVLNLALVLHQVGLNQLSEGHNTGILVIISRILVISVVLKTSRILVGMVLVLPLNMVRCQVLGIRMGIRISLSIPIRLLPLKRQIQRYCLLLSSQGNLVVSASVGREGFNSRIQASRHSIKIRCPSLIMDNW